MRLSLVSSHAERELDAIREAIRVREDVGGLDEVVTVLSLRAARDERVEALDLIAHARAPGFLILGSWIIDDSTQTAASFSELLRPALHRLGVSNIQLLGCRTATTERARKALRRIARASGCAVFGTNRYIGSGDYREGGFAGEDALVDSDGVRATHRSFGDTPKTEVEVLDRRRSDV